MYESNLTDWCAGKMGPKRDVLGELAKAVRAEGMHLGASSHRAEHDWFFDGGRHFASDVNDPKYAAFYGPAQLRQLDGDNSDSLTHDFTYVSPAFMDDWLARTAEIVERYHPDLIYFDWWVGQPDFRTHLARFATYYYNHAAAAASARRALLQAQCDGRRRGHARCGARRARRHPPAALADRYLALEPLLGLRRRRHLQVA